MRYNPDFRIRVHITNPNQKIAVDYNDQQEGGAYRGFWMDVNGNYNEAFFYNEELSNVVSSI